MRIAQVVCTFPPYKGGIGNVAQKFSEVLAEKGHSVTVFVPSDKKKTTETVHGKYQINRLKPFVSYGNAGFIPQLLRRLGYFDIIYLHYPFYGGAELVWLFKILFPDIKLIIHYHMDVHGLKWWVKILSLPSELIKRSLFRLADIVTCASIDYVKNSLIKNIYENYPDKFFEIPFGVETDRFLPVEKSGNKSKSRGEQTILFVGGLDKAHYFKGLDILIRSVAKLDNNDLRLEIIGRGDQRNKYEELAKKVGLSEKVVFYSSVDDEQLIRHYQNADIFVLPSINSNEAFGLVLLEAMACGTPVIASDLPGVSSVFNDGDQGFLVEPGSVDDLKNKLNMMLEDEEKRIGMGKAARKLVEEKYCLGKMGESIETVIQR